MKKCKQDIAQHIYFNTIHYAHVCLTVTDSSEGVDVQDLLNELVNKVLEKYDECEVQIDGEFRCNVLTEVGLCGECKKSVIAAATEIHDEAVKTNLLVGFSY